MRRFVLPLFALAALTIPCAAGAWTWPVDGPVLRPFTFGANPYAGGQHRGIDVGAPVGSLVAAPAAGTVSFTGSVPGGGRAVTIRTPDGYSVTLLQLGAIGVLRGAAIGEGDAVGTVGESLDAVTHASHVHLGVRYTASENGYVDPLSLLPPRPVAVPAPATPPAVQEPAPSEPPPPPASEAVPPGDADAPASAAEPAATPPAPVAPEPPAAAAASPAVESSSDAGAVPDAAAPAAEVDPPAEGIAQAPPPESSVAVGASADEVVDAPLEAVAATVDAPAAAAVPPAVSIALPATAVLLPAPPPIEGSPPPLPPLLQPVPLPTLAPFAAPLAARGAPAPATPSVPTQPPAAAAAQPAPTTADLRRRPRTVSRSAPVAARDGRGRRLVTRAGAAARAVAVAKAPRRRRPIPVALLLALAALGAVTAAWKAVRIIHRSDVLPDDAHLLRELDAPHRARVHDDRRRHPRPASAAARRGHVLPHGHGRARLEGVSGRGGAGTRRQGVRRSNRRELERAS
jgi:hypothetical protein